MARIRDYRGYKIEKRWCPKLRYVIPSLNYLTGRLKDIHRYIDKIEKEK